MVNDDPVREGPKNADVEESALLPVVQFGAVTGTTGLIAGSVIGTLRSPKPAVVATALGAESFLLGGFFWFARSKICKAWLIEPSSPPEDRVKASATAGGITGGIGGAIFRSRYAIVPAALVLTLFGYAGQKGYNYLDARHTHQSRIAAGEIPPEKSFWRRVADSKYSPMKVLSDAEYEQVLREKLVRIEAEIALIDEDIDRIQSKAESGHQTN